MSLDRYEGQRDMLYNQTFNLDQVAFAAEGIKDAQQTVCTGSSLCTIFNVKASNYWIDIDGTVRT